MSTQPAAPKVARQGLIASYLILNIVSGTVAGAMQIAVPLFALSLHAATGQIGLIRGVSGIGILLLVIPAGCLVDHYGPKRLFLIGGIWGTIGTFVLSYAHTPAAMALTMGISGLLGSLKMTAINASFYNNLQAMGIEKSGWFKGSMSVGLTFIGPLVGGYLVHIVPYGLLFKGFALATLLPIALVYVFHDDPVRHSSATEFKSALGQQLAEFRKLVGRRELYLPLFTEMVSTSFFATFSVFIVVIAVQSLGLPPTTASHLMIVEGGVFIATVFIAGQLIKLVRGLTLYFLSIAVVIAGLAGLALAGSFNSLIAVAALLGLGLGFINLTVSSRIGLMKGEKGKIVGLFSAAVGIGSSLGPMLGGFIGDWFGTRSIFLAFIPLFLALAVAAYRQEKKAAARDGILSETPEEVPSSI